MSYNERDKKVLISKFLTAVKNNDIHEVKRILDLDIDVESIDENDPQQNTALHLASECGHTEIVRLLMNRNPNVNKRRKDENERTSLHLAAGKGHAEVVSILLDNGADINIRGNLGMTALYRASTTGKYDAVLLLLLRGADPDIKDLFGMSAIESAALSKNQSIVDLLNYYSVISFTLKDEILEALANKIEHDYFSVTQKTTPIESHIKRYVAEEVETLWNKYKEEVNKKIDSLKNKGVKGQFSTQEIKSLLSDCLSYRVSAMLAKRSTIQSSNTFIAIDSLISKPLGLNVVKKASLEELLAQSKKDLH